MRQACPRETRVFALAVDTVRCDKRDDTSTGTSGDSEQLRVLPVHHLITRTNSEMYAWLNNLKQLTRMLYSYSRGNVRDLGPQHAERGAKCGQ